MAEVETPPVVEREALVPSRGIGESMLDRWVAQNPEQALARIDTMVTVLDRLRSASIKATYPTDWIIHTSRDLDGSVLSQKGYLQDIGAERAGKVWGIEVGEPTIRREDFPDKTFVYHMEAEAWSKVTGERIERAVGSCWSGKPFFSKHQGPDEKIDPTVIMKAGYANLHGRAVRSLSGLNGVPLDMLRAAGVDIDKVVMIDYAKGGRGGESTGASVGTADITMPWGNAKGTKVPDLTQKDLAYYLGAYERDVTDPAKAKYQKNNERMLAALKGELERRTRAAEQTAETDGQGSGEEKPSGRGQKVANLNTRLHDATKGDQGLRTKLLRAMTAEQFGLETASVTDLNEEQLDKLNTIPEQILVNTVTNIQANEAKGAGKK